jgi:hypothetical protein
MNYQLAILVLPDVFDEDTSEAFVQQVRDLRPQPSRILVVDHAKGGLGGDRRRRETLKAERAQGNGDSYWAALSKDKHGHIPASFQPLQDLHTLADEVRMRDDVEDGRRPLWEASHRFKKYSVLTAANAGLDAVMLVQFPDLFPPVMPEAFLKHLRENEDVAWCYPRVGHPTEVGLDAPVRRWRKQLPRVTELTPAGKIDEAGAMIRLAGLDLDAIRSIRMGEEPVVLLDELLKCGHGQGVARYDDEPLVYRRQPVMVSRNVASKPPGDKMRDRLVAAAVRKAASRKR